MQTWARLSNFVHRISGIMAVGAIIGLAALVVLTVADVASREMGRGSLKGAVELASMALVIVAFLGFPYGEYTKTHVRTNVVTGKLPPSVRALVRAIAGVLVVVVLVLIAEASLDRALLSLEEDERTSGSLSVPVWPSRFVIAISFIVLAIEFVIGIVDDFIAARNGTDEVARRAFASNDEEIKSPGASL